MAVSYKKLWKLLIDKDMKKKDLRSLTSISTTTMSRFAKDGNQYRNLSENMCSLKLRCWRYYRICS